MSRKYFMTLALLDSTLTLQNCSEAQQLNTQVTFKEVQVNYHRNDNAEYLVY